uniref:Uncharacterized protein n=1 Tax=Leclercia adecarboxylata TaxID=83655 RepID=A0A6H0A4E6_9ENTR|nr:hypothetical protein [Leclercia adecarboxylata]
MFIHSFEAILCNVPVDNGRKDKPLRGSACDRAYGTRAALLQSFQSRQVDFLPLRLPVLCWLHPC